MQIKTESDLIRAFMEVYKIKRGEGGTPLPAPLGVFPLYPKLIHEIRRQGFFVERHECGSIVVSDPFGDWTRTFKISSTKTFSWLASRPMFWVRPEMKANREKQSVVCRIGIHTHNGDRFPAVARAPLCWAIAKAYPECHPLIIAASRKETVKLSGEELNITNLAVAEA